MNDGMNYFRSFCLGFLVLFGAALDAEPKAPPFSPEEVSMVAQQLSELAHQKRDETWKALFKMFVAAYLGGAFEGKINWAAFKEAWAQKNITYFVRVLCASGFFAHETVSAVQNLSLAYQFDSAKRDLEAQMRKQYKPFDEQQFDLVDEKDVQEEVVAGTAAAAA